MKPSLKSNMALALAALLLTLCVVGAPGVGNATILTDNTTTDPSVIQGLDRLNTDITGGWGYWIASAFKTDSQSFNLTSVTLNAFQETKNPNYYSENYWADIPAAAVQMYLYSNTSGVPGDHTNPGLPGASLGMLTSPTSFTSVPDSAYTLFGDYYYLNPTAFTAQATFTTSGITLDPNSFYWIVIQPLTGSLVWDAGAAPTGPGAVAAWAIDGYPTVDFSTNPPTFTPHAGWNSAYDPSLGGFQDNSYGDTPPYYMMKVEGSAVPAPCTLLLLGSGLLGLAGLRLRKKV